MKNIILTIALTSLSLYHCDVAFSQTYTTTESKSCGSCGGAVSVNSRVGMTCPHCGVRWGYENTTTKQSTSYSYDNSYDYNSYSYGSSYGTTTTNLNLRSSASTSSYKYLTIPKGKQVEIISSYGAWYYVKYKYWNGYSYTTQKGYVSSRYIR